MNNAPIFKPCCPPDQIEVVTVDTPAGIKGLSNCVVYVLSNATSYFVNSKHNITVISSMPVFVPDYDYVANPRKLRNQVCYDFANDRAIIYDASGDYRLMALTGGKDE